MGFMGNDFLFLWGGLMMGNRKRNAEELEFKIRRLLDDWW